MKIVSLKIITDDVLKHKWSESLRLRSSRYKEWVGFFFKIISLHLKKGTTAITNPCSTIECNWSIMNSHNFDTKFLMEIGRVLRYTLPPTPSLRFKKRPVESKIITAQLDHYRVRKSAHLMYDPISWVFWFSWRSKNLEGVLHLLNKIFGNVSRLFILYQLF